MCYSLQKDACITSKRLVRVAPRTRKPTIRRQDVRLHCHTNGNETQLMAESHADPTDKHKLFSRDNCESYDRQRLHRRDVLLGGACMCGCCVAQPAFSGTELAKGSWYDSFFAWNMQNGMGRYEASIRPVKLELFGLLFGTTAVDSDADSSSSDESGSSSDEDINSSKGGSSPGAIAIRTGYDSGCDTGCPDPAGPASVTGQTGAQPEPPTSVAAPLRVLELGFGSGPNLPYYASLGPANIQVVGLEPKSAFWDYAMGNAQAAGFSAASGSSDMGSTGRWLQLVQGSGEDLPFGDGEFDAAVCTLVLCSVADQKACLAELHRVLRPGGRLLFIEHVVAPQQGLVRLGQQLLDPLQQRLADGCHLTRDTLGTITSSGLFSNGSEGDVVRGTRVKRFDVDGLGPIAPHAAGVVMKA